MNGKTSFVVTVCGLLNTSHSYDDTIEVIDDAFHSFSDQLYAPFVIDSLDPDSLSCNATVCEGDIRADAIPLQESESEVLSALVSLDEVIRAIHPGRVKTPLLFSDLQRFVDGLYAGVSLLHVETTPCGYLYWSDNDGVFRLNDLSKEEYVASMTFQEGCSFPADDFAYVAHLGSSLSEEHNRLLREVTFRHLRDNLGISKVLFEYVLDSSGVKSRRYDKFGVCIGQRNSVKGCFNVHVVDDISQYIPTQR